MTDTESFLAERIRHVVEKRAPEVCRVGGESVCGAGVSWRGGYLKLVVQTDSMDNVAMLRQRLPDEVEGFPVVIEVEDAPTWLDGAASSEAMPGVSGRPACRAWRSLLRFVGLQRDRLATIAKRPSELTPEPRA